MRAAEVLDLTKGKKSSRLATVLRERNVSVFFIGPMPGSVGPCFCRSCFTSLLHSVPDRLHSNTVTECTHLHKF
jgi:hypothetical protein